jgi:hypothetical protein
MASDEPIYRIIFTQFGKSYELYARFISEDHLMGFIEIEEIVFKETSSGVVVDPSDEKLKLEFKGVKRSYIPIHLISRIDEVSKVGEARVNDISDKASNVSPFPNIYQPIREE